MSNSTIIDIIIELPENSTAFAATAIFGTLNAFFFGFMFWYYYRRKEHVIQKRLPYVCLVNNLIQIICVNYWLTKVMGFHTDLVPCYLDLYINYALVPLAISCYIVRILHLVVMFYVQRAKLQLTSIDNGQHKNLLESMNSIERLMIKLMARLNDNTTKSDGSRPNSSKIESIINSVQDGKVSVNRQVPISTNNDMVTIPESDLCIRKNDIKAFLDSVECVGSKQLLTLLLKVFIFNSLVLLVILLASFEQIHTIEPNCTLAIQKLPLYAELMFGFLVAIPLGLYATKKTSDKLWIRTEIILSLVSFVLAFMVYLYAVAKQSRGFTFWPAAQNMFGFCINIIFPIGLSYANVKQPKKHIDFQRFMEFLMIPSFIAEFKSYLASLFCVENAIFVEEYRKAKFRMESIPVGQRDRREIMIRTQCKKLYSNFVEIGSRNELNLPSHITRQIKAQMSSQTYHESMFEPVYTEVVKMMYENNASKFFMQHSLDTWAISDS